MSALCQKRTHATQQNSNLFEHVVGDRDQPWRNLDAKRSRHLKVDRKLEFGRLQNRQIGGLGAFENFARIDADLTMNSDELTPPHDAPGRTEHRINPHLNSGRGQAGGYQCPLWVKSRLVQHTSQCPLCANSGHSAIHSLVGKRTPG